MRTTTVAAVSLAVKAATARTSDGKLRRKSLVLLTLPAGAIGRHVVPFRISRKIVDDKNMSVKVKFAVDDEEFKAKRRVGKDRKFSFCGCPPNVEEVLTTGENWTPPGDWENAKIFPTLTFDQGS
jgi:hypothetical protein